MSFNFTVPNNAEYDETWMRARFAYDGDEFPTDALMGGMAYTGEVEDYMVDMVSESELFFCRGQDFLDWPNMQWLGIGC